MNSFIFTKNPIIPAVRDEETIKEAIDSSCELLFLLAGDIYSLPKYIDIIKNANKEVVVHVDLIKGFSGDMVFLKYLKETLGASGIITTKHQMIRMAKSIDLFAIQRIFVFDSAAVKVAKDHIEKLKPDAIEILPGLVPKIVKSFAEEITCPLITGGFIEYKEEVINAINAGAFSVTTSEKDLWKNNTKILELLMKN